MEDDFEAPAPPRPSRGRIAYDLVFAVLPAVVPPLTSTPTRAGLIAFAVMTGCALAVWALFSPRLRRSAAYYVGPLLTGALGAMLGMGLIATNPSVHALFKAAVILGLWGSLLAYVRAANDALWTAQSCWPGFLVLPVSLVGALLTLAVPILVGTLFWK